MKNDKLQLLETLRRHIASVQGKVAEERERVSIRANKSLREIGAMQPADQPVYMQLKAYAQDRMEQLDHLHQTPYFTKCEVVENGTGEKKEYYFSKHQLSEESIYSWVAPIAMIRFEAPGEITYVLPDGEKRDMMLVSKEQYMIVDGKVLFFAKESTDMPRELIYQENFTTRKHGFMLPEIVAQMEKAQDKVIRAHYHGPLVIAGPAGSGKTTLALHRVAYLMQAPDTAALYPAESIIVFVQDNGTKEYFSQLLPGLGIHHVLITTFSEWALMVLGLSEHSYAGRYGNTEEEKDAYEYKKLKALREQAPAFEKNPYAALAKAYKKYFTARETKIFQQQKAEMQLDRFDLAILLRAYMEKYGKFETQRHIQAIVKGKQRSKIRKTPIAYSLAVVDEFQNYLPEQLALINRCISEQIKSVVYVGDTAQQVYLGTIRNWAEIREVIPHDRDIRLDKVYRNTKNILSFIQSLGYVIGIPPGIKEGPAVTEKITGDQKDEIDHICRLLAAYGEGSVGILAKDAEYLEPFKKEFETSPNVHVLTMNESQGVEFDAVCIVGIDEKTFALQAISDTTPEHIAERKRMQRDLLYVALTRAITELHILGRQKLSILLSSKL